MEWWRWMLGSAAALLVLGLLALRFDTLKDRRDSSAAIAARTLAPYSAALPVVFLLGLLSPWWIGLIVVAVPAVILLAMAAIDS